MAAVSSCPSQHVFDVYEAFRRLHTGRLVRQDLDKIRPGLISRRLESIIVELLYGILDSEFDLGVG